MVTAIFTLPNVPLASTLLYSGFISKVKLFTNCLHLSPNIITFLKEGYVMPPKTHTRTSFKHKFSAFFFKNRKMRNFTHRRDLSFTDSRVQGTTENTFSLLLHFLTNNYQSTLPRTYWATNSGLPPCSVCQASMWWPPPCTTWTMLPHLPRYPQLHSCSSYGSICGILFVNPFDCDTELVVVNT